MQMRSIQFLAPRMQFEILLSTYRHHYLTRKLKQVVGRAVSVFGEDKHVEVAFHRLDLEVEFGPKGPIPPMTYELDNGVKVEVRGRIDRVDQAIGDDGLYFVLSIINRVLAI